jgi:hypothetical protein
MAGRRSRSFNKAQRGSQSLYDYFTASAMHFGIELSEARPSVRQ